MVSLFAVPAQVQWEAPAQCPDQSSVRDALADKLGQGQGDDSVHVEARVRQTSAGSFVAQIDLEGRPRTLEAADCQALADAVVLLVAVHVEARRSNAPDEDADAGELVPEVGVEPVVTQQDVRPDESSLPPSEPRNENRALESAAAEPIVDAAPPRPATTWRRDGLVGFLRAEASAQFHVVDVVAGAVSLAGGLRIGRARVEVQLRYVPPHHVRTDEDGPSARLQAMIAGVAGCFEPRVRRVTFPVCASLHGGGVRGRGRDNVATPQVAWGPWLSGAATAGLRVNVAPRVSLRLRGGPELIFVQRRFVAGPDRVPVHDPRFVGGLVGLGIELDFSSRKGSVIPTKG